MYELRCIIFLSLLPLLGCSQEVRPDYNTGTGFFVKDGKIFDSTGEEFIPMGFNTSAFWAGNADCKKNNMSVHIPNSGANAVRIVSQTEGAFGWNANPEAQRDLIDRAVRSQLVPMLEMHDATCDEPQFEKILSYWTSEKMVQLCRDYEQYLWVNIANEHNFTDFETWRDQYKAAVRQLREAGIKNPIVIDAGRNCGQNPEMFKAYGAEVLADDPEQNVIFSIHLYGFWKSEDKTFSDWTPPYTVEVDLPAMKEAGLPLIIGEFGWDEPEGAAGNYTADRILSTCAANGIGWYFWSFYDGEDKPYYSVLKNVCNGIPTSNLTVAGAYLLPYLQENAQTASIYNTVSASTLSRAPALKIYPNPSDGTFTINEMPIPGRVRIADAQGRLLRTVFLQQPTLDLSGWNAGTYFLQIGREVYKVVKQ